MSYRFSHSVVQDKTSTYWIAWEKDGVEIVSSEVVLAGTPEGVEAALRFAAEDLMVAHQELFVPDIAEVDFQDIEEVENAVN